MEAMTTNGAAQMIAASVAAAEAWNRVLYTREVGEETS